MMASDAFQFIDEKVTTLQYLGKATTPPEASFLVTVISGPDAGLKHVVDGASEVYVGQSPVCQIRLTDATVSRRHLSLDIHGTRLRAADLESSNGTFVGNLAIERVLLSGGEQLRVGVTTLRVDRGQPINTAEPPQALCFGKVVGASIEMRRIFPLLDRLAQSTLPILIEGETGTGKEVVAEALHEASPRCRGPFVVFDCTTVATNLLESELFGHEKGAFTGAVAARKGVFEQAHGGTIFIDELGELPLEMQAKLLRALEKSEVRRVGGDKWIHSDVRVIAATRRDMDKLVQSGHFRDDLFHRLAVGRVVLPPLRKRHGDVPLLVEHFCHLSGGNSSCFPMQLLAQWDEAPWPGNLRELRNAVARRLALGDFDMASLSVNARSLAPLAGADAFAEVLELCLPFPEARERISEQFRQRYIEDVLQKHGGNVAKAAAASGIALRYFQLLRARSKGR